MKKLSITAAFFCLFLAGGVFAQNAKTSAANFAGTWELDAAKSKLPERMRIESMTLTVAQSDTELKVETNVKRAPRPDGEMPNGGNGSGGAQSNGNRGGGYGRGGMIGFASPATYSLVKGQHTDFIPENPAGTPSTVTTMTASAEKDGKLKLNQSTKISSQNGEITVNTHDVWELLDKGATLKIVRETETPRGSQTAEMYFTREDFMSALPNNEISNYQAPAAAAPAQSTASSAVVTNPAIKMISAGVLNGKAKKLPTPVYPAEAKAEKAEGTVNVEIILDEQGKVVSATAVSGHPMLRVAAEEAARSAEFGATKLSGIPVKVKGIIVYNFIL